MSWVSGRVRRVALPPLTRPRTHGGLLVGVWSQATRRGFFVCFQHTPNESCYKFYVDGVMFLPPEANATLVFDRRNDYQSPLASHLLQSLPMVEEVAVGSDFITVKRVEEDDAAAAARYFVHCTSDVHTVHNSPSDEAADTHDALSGTTTTTTTTHGSVTEEDVQNEASEDDDSTAVVRRAIQGASWDELRLHVSALLTDHLYRGAPHIAPDAPLPHSDTVIEPEDDEVVRMIKELVRDMVRPRLQEDGGDIRLVGYDGASGVMRVEMLGACRTCRSSKITLVDRIERTVRHWIPEVTAVVQVMGKQTALEQFVHASHASSRDVGDGEDEEERAPSPSRNVSPSPLREGEGEDEGEGEVQEGDEEKRAAVSGSAPPCRYRIVRHVHVGT